MRGVGLSFSGLGAVPLGFRASGIGLSKVPWFSVHGFGFWVVEGSTL